jgi:single-strand DNA-binding protein
MKGSKTMSINKVFITGNLTRDAELKTTQGGTAILDLSVAVNDRVKGNDGQWEDRPNFIDCTLFGARAEGLAKYLAKGSKVTIEGKLRWSQWEQDGQKRSRITIIVDNIEFLSKVAGDAPIEGEIAIDDEDVPF